MLFGAAYGDFITPLTSIPEIPVFGLAYLRLIFAPAAISALLVIC